MGKYFLATTKHAKAQGFLELKQGMMTVMEYAAKFTELARFADNYVATNMAKVRRFEDGLKLSIRGKIVGFLLHDMDSMVRTAIAIERERSRTHGASEIRVLVARERRVSPLPVRERIQRLLVREGFRVASIRAKVRPGLAIRQDRRRVISAIILEI